MRIHPQHTRAFFYLSLLSSLLAACTDVTAAFGKGKPPAGYMRPPYHVKKHSNTSPSGYPPAQIRHAYGFDRIANQGQGQVIAIIDAYEDPAIESNLGVFSLRFGLPPCSSGNQCFRKIYAAGTRPKANAGWSLEIALDVEWAHAIAPQARILLVEAASSSNADLMQAVDVAVRNGASVVSMSFGGSESASELGYDRHFMVPGVTFVASSGDSGNGAEYPAASPWVVSVGGTTLALGSNGQYLSETAWSGSGGGISRYEPEPPYQQQYQIPFNPAGRGIPDVAYIADPNTGVAVYDSFKYQGQQGWFEIGGTSAGAPQWAALVAIANAMRAAEGKATLQNMPGDLYAIASQAFDSDFHDITTGSNGHCVDLCQAAHGYDYVTGLGSPQADRLLPALVAR